AELVVTAATAGGVIMGLQHRDLPLHGVQFHPESVLTEGGHRLLANWLAVCGLDGAVERSAGMAPLVRQTAPTAPTRARRRALRSERVGARHAPGLRAATRPGWAGEVRSALAVVVAPAAGAAPTGAATAAGALAARRAGARRDDERHLGADL